MRSCSAVAQFLLKPCSLANKTNLLIAVIVVVSIGGLISKHLILNDRMFNSQYGVIGNHQSFKVKPSINLCET